MTLILSGTNGVSDVDGSASTPAIRGSDSNTGIFFPAADTIAFAEGGAEVMRIDSFGNLLVGTTSARDTGGTRSVAINAGALAASLDLTCTSGRSYAIYTSSSATGLQFYDLTANAERARIDSSGTLLLNRTSSYAADNKLVVQSNCLSAVMAEFNDTDTTSSNNIIRFRKNGTEAGRIAVTTSNTTQYLTSSDYRLKENVQPMAGALARVAALKPCTYTWKTTGEAGEGFIAHELQAVCPDSVAGEKDAVDANGNPQYQGIDTSFLVATLTAALQEAHGLIKALEQRVAALEGA